MATGHLDLKLGELSSSEFIFSSRFPLWASTLSVASFCFYSISSWGILVFPACLARPERWYKTQESWEGKLFLLHSYAAIGILSYPGLHQRILNFTVALDGEKPFFLLVTLYVHTFSPPTKLQHAIRMKRAGGWANYGGVSMEPSPKVALGTIKRVSFSGAHMHSYHIKKWGEFYLKQICLF